MPIIPLVWQVWEIKTSMSFGSDKGSVLILASIPSCTLCIRILEPRSSPVVSSLSAEKLASLQFPPTGEPLGMCTPLKLSFPQLPAVYVTLILETHQWRSPASGPTPESPLGFLANSTLTLPPLPQAKEGFPLTSNHLLTSSAPFPPQICLPSQMAVAGLDQL